MTRTEAPKDLAGRGLENLARTTPELPGRRVRITVGLKRIFQSIVCGSKHTVRAGDLAPDHADLGATDLLGTAVNESDTLAEVEAGFTRLADARIARCVFRISEEDLLGALDIVDTLNLDEGGAGTGNVTRALVAQVTSPVKHWSAQNSFRLFRSTVES